MISFGSCIYPTLGSVKVSPSRVASPENNQHQTLKVSGVTPRPELPPITLVRLFVCVCVIMPRAELRRHTVIVLSVSQSVSLSFTSISRRSLKTKR